jgi:hypothetical protein
MPAHIALVGGLKPPQKKKGRKKAGIYFFNNLYLPAVRRGGRSPQYLQKFSIAPQAHLYFYIILFLYSF